VLGPASLFSANSRRLPGRGNGSLIGGNRPPRCPLCAQDPPSSWLLSLLIRTHIWLCPRFNPSSFLSSAYFSYSFCGGSEGLLTMSGQCDIHQTITLTLTWVTSSWLVDLPPNYFCSNLSGQFFLFNPLSAVGTMIGRILPQTPYLHVGSTWALKRKYEGVCA
jgi:hypothetical protein